MALFYCNAFRWEELEGRASQTQPSFYCDKTPKAVAVRRRRPRPSAQASSCPAAGEKERTTRSKWKKHMWQKRERERESQNRASVMESVFPTKVSSPTVVPVLLLECSIFWKVAAPPCQLPRGRSNGGGRIDRRAEKWRMRLSDRWSSGSS